MIYCGDVMDQLSRIPNGSIDCCVTSPPYWGLRDYGVEGQLGLEKTPEEYVDKMVEVFHEVRRVLRDDGTLWLILGDTYNGPQPGSRDPERWPKQSRNDHAGSKTIAINLKQKDLVGIPWRVAFALQADGWYLRSDIIWNKPNPMPESVTDRPTKAHEYLFLMSKSQTYYYDAEAIEEPSVYAGVVKHAYRSGAKDRENISKTNDRRTRIGLANWNQPVPESRNKRTVWTVSTQPFPEAHFAVFPPKLIEPCILAGSPEGGHVLDPFCGSGTTGIVAINRKRIFSGIELNPEYVAMAEARIKRETAQEHLFA